MWTNSFTLEQLGEFLQDVRRERDLTQAQFARRLGISHATLSNLEQGRPVSSATLQKAIQMLDMRMVIAPKSARVLVEEAEGRAQEGGSAPW